MADTGVQPVPLPRYNLPNVTYGQEPISGFPSFAQGMQTGMQPAQLGLQAGALGLQAKELAQKQQQAQMQMRAMQQKNLIDYSAQLDATLKNTADVDHGMAISFYKEKLLPLHNMIGAQYGLPQMDPNAINAEDNTPKELQRVATLYHTLISDPKMAPYAQDQLNEIFTKEIYNKKISEAAGTSLKMGMDYNKHQDELVQQQRQNEQSLRSDPVIQQVELKRLAAGQVYDQMKSYQDAKGNYNVTAPQLVDIYANLYRAQSGVGISGEALPMMDQKTAQGNYSKLAAYFGLSKNALPKELGDRLLGMADQLGTFNEAQHAQMMQGRNTPNIGIDSVHAASIAQNPSSRGPTFQEMKAKSNADYAARTQAKTPQAYLQSIGAKVTPANLKWAETKMMAQ